MGQVIDAIEEYEKVLEIFAEPKNWKGAIFNPIDKTVDPYEAADRVLNKYRNIRTSDLEYLIKDAERLEGLEEELETAENTISDLENDLQQAKNRIEELEEQNEK